MLKDLENLSTNIDLLISEKKQCQDQFLALNEHIKLLQEENKKIKNNLAILKQENDLLCAECSSLREKVCYTQNKLAEILNSLSF